ncbi:MAG: hypothetical protein M1834_008052 [Cirrosporium novae-zelandiae]|nr:MAG: hypothetical protein M1834_008052 [Cirrosporium novae-zelandiae]
MVHLDIVHACNAILVETQPLVAVFVGGTSGIGECSVRALTATHANRGKGLRLYIVGRNNDAAEKIISDCLEVCPTGQFRFVRANDLSLLKDVDRVCAEIVQAEGEANTTGGIPRVDLLVMTQGYLSLESRKETKEGLDTVLSLVYYSRMRFVTQLLPLLLASPLSGRVVSIFAPGREGKIFPDDLSLRDPTHYGLATNASHAVYMTTFFMENLAARHAGRLSLAHVYPGLVMTKVAENGDLPRWARWMWRFLVAPVVWPLAVPTMECGERVLFLASPRFPARPLNSTEETSKSASNFEIAISSDGMVGGGAYRVTWNGEIIPTGKAYEKIREEGLSERVWNHTMKAFGEIEAGNFFTG